MGRIIGLAFGVLVFVCMGGMSLIAALTQH